MKATLKTSRTVTKHSNAYNLLNGEAIYCEHYDFMKTWHMFSFLITQVHIVVIWVLVRNFNFIWALGPVIKVVLAIPETAYANNKLEMF